MTDYMKGHTLHHVEGGKRLQIVKTDIHDAFKHTGGRASLAQQTAEVFGPRTAAILFEGGQEMTFPGLSRALAEDTGESLDPGVTQVLSNENRESFAKGFDRVVGATDETDYMKSYTAPPAKVDWGKMWQGFKNYITNKDLEE